MFSQKDIFSKAKKMPNRNADVLFILDLFEKNPASVQYIPGSRTGISSFPDGKGETEKAAASAKEEGVAQAHSSGRKRCLLRQLSVIGTRTRSERA